MASNCKLASNITAFWSLLRGDNSAPSVTSETVQGKIVRGQ